MVWDFYYLLNILSILYLKKNEGTNKLKEKGWCSWWYGSTKAYVAIVNGMIKHLDRYIYIYIYTHTYK